MMGVAMAYAADGSWSYLESHVGSDTLMFDSSAAKLALDACNALIGHLLTVQDSVGDVSSLDNFAGPAGGFNSGPELTTQYATLGQKLAEAVKTNLKVANDMADTFVAAAKIYVNSEIESADRFSALESFTHTGRATEPSGPNGKASLGNRQVSKPGGDAQASLNSVPVAGAPNIIGVGGVPVALGMINYQAPKDDRSVHPENPYHKEWENLFDFGVSINAAPAALAGDRWLWMAAEIRTAFTNFQDTLNDNGLLNLWKGGAKEKAVDAIRQVYTDGFDLATVAETIGNDLRNTASWLRSTKSSMPQTRTPPKADNQPNNPLLTGLDPSSGITLGSAQQACLFYYCAGIMTYNSNFRTLPLPSVAVQAPAVPASPGSPVAAGGTQPTVTPTPTPTPTLTPDPTPTPSPSPSPSPTTPTTPTPTTSDSTLKTLIEQGASVLSTGLTTLGTVATQVSTAVQKQIESNVKSAGTGTPSAGEGQQGDQSLLAGLQSLGSGGGTGGSAGGGAAGGAAGTQAAALSQKLFPRSTVAKSAEEETTTVAAGSNSRAGVAATASGTGTTSSSGMGGMGSPGMNAAGQGQKEAKRASYLDSSSNLDEVLDAAPAAVTPVAER